MFGIINVNVTPQYLGKNIVKIPGKFMKNASLIKETSEDRSETKVTVSTALLLKETR